MKKLCGVIKGITSAALVVDRLTSIVMNHDISIIFRQAEVDDVKLVEHAFRQVIGFGQINIPAEGKFFIDGMLFRQICGDWPHRPVPTAPGVIVETLAKYGFNALEAQSYRNILMAGNVLILVRCENIATIQDVQNAFLEEGCCDMVYI